MSNIKLPALPVPIARLYRDKTNQKRWDSRACSGDDIAVYSAQYMRDYAEAAILADRERQAGEAVAWMMKWPNHSPSFTTDKSDYVTWFNGKPSYPEELIPLFASLPAPQAVQDGWKLVPVEPTEGMRAAIVSEMDRQEAHWQYNPVALYMVMLAAAPSPDGKAEQAEAPSYCDSTPLLHVGESSFEGWFSDYNPAGKGDKQRMRDAYAAGMGDPLVTYASKAEQAEAPSDAAREVFAAGIVHHYGVPEETSFACARRVLALATQPTASNAGERLEWAVSECWSSANPNKKVLVLARDAEEAERDEQHHSFIRWVHRAALASKPPAGEQKPVGYVATVDLGKPVSMAIYSPEEFHSWPNKRLVEEGHYVPLYLAQQPEQVEQVEQDDGPADCPNCDGGRFCSKRACNEPDAASARGEGERS